MGNYYYLPYYYSHPCMWCRCKYHCPLSPFHASVPADPPPLLNLFPDLKIETSLGSLFPEINLLHTHK